MRSIARGLVVGSAAALLVLSASFPAQAKVPPFAVEWSPETPMAGEVVRFIVRFWEDQEHTVPARWLDSGTLDGLLLAFPPSLDPADALEMELVRIRRGVYRGKLTFPASGTWSLCTWETECPAGAEMPGYPGRLDVTITEPPAASLGVAPAAAAEAPGEVTTVSVRVVTVGLAAVGVIALLGIRLFRRRSQPSPVPGR